VAKYSTYFIDIDGTILNYRPFDTYTTTQAQLTPGSREKLVEIKEAGHKIILTTARPENLRGHTEYELSVLDVVYDGLVMGIERGPRHLVNDLDPATPGDRAISWNLTRDTGLSTVQVDQVSDQ
jgi:hypothetical protein